MDSEHIWARWSAVRSPDVQKLFFSGKLKIGGNVMASNKLIVLQGMDKAAVEEARRQRLASGVTAAAPVAEAARPGRAKEVFADLARRIDGNAALAGAKP
jgi:hypothetical protein